MPELEIRFMNKKSSIYVAGHTGLVGSAIVRKLLKSGYKNLILKSHRELDLTNQKKTEAFLEKISLNMCSLQLPKLVAYLQMTHIQQILYIRT